MGLSAPTTIPTSVPVIRVCARRVRVHVSVCVSVCVCVCLRVCVVYLCMTMGGGRGWELRKKGNIQNVRPIKRSDL